MSKPINFNSSNNLSSTRQPLVNNKDSVFVKGNPINSNPTNPISTPSSVSIIGGMSRPSTNVGNSPGTNAEINYNHAKKYIGITGNACVRRAIPMKHWRRESLMNEKNGKSYTSIDIVNRPGGSSFRGYKFDSSDIYYDSIDKSWKSKCNCDASGNNMFITFDNKLLQNTSKSIKPPAVLPPPNMGSAGGQVGYKIYNPGYVQVGNPDASGSYQIQTGIYNIKRVCGTLENNVIKYSGNTNLSNAYYSDSKAYLKSRCKLYNQKLSTIPLSGIDYIDDKGNPIHPSDDVNGTQNFRTTSCSLPYQNERYNTCTRTIYKRSNPTFASQSAVDNSTRIAKLKYDTITLNGNSFRSAWGDSAANAGKYHGNINGSAPYFIKSKYTPPTIWRRQGKKLVCNNCTGRTTKTVLSSFWGGSIN